MSQAGHAASHCRHVGDDEGQLEEPPLRLLGTHLRGKHGEHGLVHQQPGFVDVRQFARLLAPLLGLLPLLLGFRQDAQPRLNRVDFATPVQLVRLEAGRLPGKACVVGRLQPIRKIDI